MAKRRQLTVEQVLAILAETPASLAHAVSDVSPGKLQTRPGAGEWSATEILAHLRACADVWGGCIETILGGNQPTIRGISPTHWIRETDYPQQEFKESLDAFSAQREGLVTKLRSLSEQDWLCSATVTGAGRPLVKTVFDYAERLARHERPHVQQIARAVEAVR